MLFTCSVPSSLGRSVSACTVLLIWTVRVRTVCGLLGDELDDDGYFDRGCYIQVCTVAEDNGHQCIALQKGIKHDRMHHF